MADEPRSLDPIRVLVCDDHFLIREGLKSVLGRVPQLEVVAEAETAEDAIGMVDDLLPDVVVMDVVLPGIDGIQATRRIKQAHPSVGVIVLTRFEDTEHILQIYRAGASAYLVKGVKGEELVRTIHSVHNKAVVLHPRVANAVIDSFQAAPEMAPAPIQPGLSPRELDVLRLVGQGLSNKEIARTLGISLRTAQNHIANIFRKLELNDRVSAAVYALNQGLSHPRRPVSPAPVAEDAGGTGRDVAWASGGSK